MTPLPKKAHWPPAYLYIQTAAIALAVWYYCLPFYVDDAFISLRYAHNLLAGNGLTWNPGERVEGYTDFLFILFEAGLGWFGMDLVLASRVIAFAGFFGLMAALWAYTAPSRRTDAYGDKVCAALCVSLVGSSVPLLTWCMGGLEGTLYACFNTAAICLTLQLLQGKASAKRAGAIGVLFALATLTRPDGIVFCAFTLVFLGVSRRVKFAQIAMIACVFAAFVGPHMLWRFAYYGEWMPNTYFAKAAFIDSSLIWPRGIFYVIQYLYIPPMLLLFGAGMVMALARRSCVTLSVTYLAALAVVFLAYIVSVGGDHMPYLRFMIPLVPVLALLVYHCGLLMIVDREKWLRDICGALVFFSIFQFGMVQTDEGYSRGAVSGLAVSDYVKAHWPKDSLIAVDPAGALPYSATEYRYIDMLGLMDKHIARRVITAADAPRLAARPIGHLKGDGKYVLERAPDYIIFGDAWGDEGPRFLSDLEIAAQPSFKKHYERVEIYVTPPPALLPQLKRMAQENIEEAKKNPDVLKGPVMDGERLRFIYFKKKL